MRYTFDSAALSACKTSAARPHLAVSHKDIFGRNVLTIHAAKSTSTKRDRDALRSRVNGTCDSRVRVRAVSDRALSGARCLEQLISGCAKGDIAFDPTGAFSRSLALVNYARSVRDTLGSERVAGVFWQAEWRTVYVVLNHKAYISDRKMQIADLAAAETASREALKKICGDEYIRALRIGFELPAAVLVPVDRASMPSINSSLAGLAKFAKVPALALMVGAGVAGHAAADDAMGQRPAVSGINGKIAIIGGLGNDFPTSAQFTNYENVKNPTIENTSTFLGAGSLTLPIGNPFGFQLDGLAGTTRNGLPQGAQSNNEKLGSQTVLGVGAHLFWRDPKMGLAGLTASYNHFSKLSDASDQEWFRGSYGGELLPERSVTRVGVEGELYLDQFTIGANAGWQVINLEFSDYVKANSTNVPKDKSDGLYGGINFSWYATDNLMLSAGVAADHNTDYVASAGVEWAPALNSFHGLSVFADTSFGDNDYVSGMVGLRFYFGDNKSLKERHRYDDPVNNLALQTLATSSGSNFFGY